MNSARPSAAICLAVEEAIDAEETLSTMIGRQMIAWRRKRSAREELQGLQDQCSSVQGTLKRKGAASSSISGWDVVPSTPLSLTKDPRKKTFRELDLEDLLKEEDMQQLLKLLDERRMECDQEAYGSEA